MAQGKAVAIVVDDVEKRELTAPTRKHGAAQVLAERARIVLAAASGLKNKEIAAKYNEQWLKLLDMSAEIRAFIAANEAQLRTKDRS
jgi:DNA-binding NarL/FixJ family response regulator